MVFRQKGMTMLANDLLQIERLTYDVALRSSSMFLFRSRPTYIKARKQN